MPGPFGERTPEETGSGFGDWCECPECGEEGREHAVRNHLREKHGWSQDKIEDRFGTHPFDSLQDDNNPAVDVSEPMHSDPMGDMGESASEISWLELDDRMSGRVEESTDKDLCEHEEYKEVIVKQSSAGVKMMGAGLSSGGSITKIVCKKCGQEYDVTETGTTEDGPGLI
jgi:hypothetical protein